MLSFGDVAKVIGSQLNVRMLIALPCILLPLWLAVRSGLRPLSRLSSTIAARREDDLAPLDISAPHAELSPLVQALDGLMRRVRARLARERAFVHDAAHELRTPLAVISAQAAVLAKADNRQAHDAAEQSHE